MKKFTKAAKDLKKIVVDGAAEFSAKSSTGLPNSKISSTIPRISTASGHQRTNE